MAQASRLSAEEVESALPALPGWTVLDGKLHREYRFPDFTHAFAFMTAAAIASEKMDHHPDWSNVYGRVTIDLWTHTAGGITGRDTKLAGIFESIANKLLS